ncbi:hypothetical protein [Streptomyces canus]|uniref:hypothetical protein n=1 Tax=Streptomyces canus TaxID=58343 RepID=UPI002E372849|nr:hypothetical protein [Streptomyces canus]
MTRERSCRRPPPGHAPHGDRDRVTSPADTADCVRRARGRRHGRAWPWSAGATTRCCADTASGRTAAAVVAHLLDPDGTPDPLPRDSYGAGDIPVP